MSTEKPKITDAQRDFAQRQIESLIASPPARRDHREPFPESSMADSPIAKQAVDSLRRKLAADRGMTYEQWLEEEGNVSHPREVVPIVPSHHVIARRRMSAAGVPKMFIEDVIDKQPIDCEPFRAVKEFLNSRDGFRVLSGGKGTKKTGSAAWSLGQVDGGAFVRALDVTRLSIEQRDKWDAICSAKIVVLDDLGFEKRDEKGAFQVALSELIDRVYGDRRRLIITCNLRRETFRDVYGEREYDRMRHVGKWTTVSGESSRQYAFGGNE